MYNRNFTTTRQKNMSVTALRNLSVMSPDFAARNPVPVAVEEIYQDFRRLRHIQVSLRRRRTNIRDIGIYQREHYIGYRPSGKIRKANVNVVTLGSELPITVRGGCYTHVFQSSLLGRIER